MRLPSLHLSRRSYVTLTVAGILLPTLFLGILGLHLVHRFYRFQGEIVRDYSRFSVEYAATEIQRRVTDQERDIASYLQLSALVSEFVPEDELRSVEDAYPLVANAFARGLDGTLRFARRPASPAGKAAEPAGITARRDSSRARAARIVERVLDETTVRHVLLSGDIHFYVGTDSVAPYQLVAFPNRAACGTERGVLGFFLATELLRAEVGRVLNTTIHTAEGRFAPDFGEVLTLVVLDERSEVIYTHAHGSQAVAPPKIKRWLAQTELGGVLPGWTVGITYAKPSGFAWMQRVLSVQVILVVLAAGLVLLGTLFTTRFSLRQMELSRVKSHFVSNITHELKTPLAAIRLYTETLQQGRVRDGAEAERFLGIIHKETGRLTALINNILDFARIEDGRRRYRFASASVGEIVRDVVDTYAYQLRSKGFDVQLDVAGDLPPVLVDRDALGQAVLNLLDNAAKYSRDVKHVVVSVHREDGVSLPDGEIVVRVRDLGIGIQGAEQERIFEAFYRVEKGLEHDVKGSGLGLAVVKHVAEAHGGRVEVESRPDEGSTFTLRIPVRSAGDAAGTPGGTAPAEATTGGPHATGPSGGNATWASRSR